MTREELSQMVELLRDTAKLHQPNEEILTDVKAESFVFVMDSVLSADVRPNIHGHWEEDGHGHIICSACKEANVSTWKSRFCPMCGADMRGKAE